MTQLIRISTKRFRKDVRRLAKAGADLSRLKSVIDILVTGASLPAIYLDHPLQGALSKTRVCHIGPDWLLQYMKDGKRLILLLIATGNHRHVLSIE